MIRDARFTLHLAYLDDGGKGNVKVFGGIVIDHTKFFFMEFAASFIAHQLIPAERRDSFKEFHASDLFVGEGAFKNIDEEERHKALLRLVGIPHQLGVVYVYSAVDINKLNNSPLRSASWIDTAFNMCAGAIDEWLLGEYSAMATDAKSKGQYDKFATLELPLSLMILDEPEQHDKDKGRLRDSFRLRRHKALKYVRSEMDEPRPISEERNRLSASVDELFFGNSADSVGLQVADACNWVIWRYLSEGIDNDFFRTLMRGRVISAKHEPEWTQYRHLFRSHD